MIDGFRISEQVKDNTHLLPRLEKLLMITVSNLARLLPLFFRPKRYRRTVHIGARDHQYLVTFDTVVADKDICRQIRPGNMPQMERPVSVGPGYTNKDSLTHIIPSQLCHYVRKLWEES